MTFPSKSWSQTGHIWSSASPPGRTEPASCFSFPRQNQRGISHACYYHPKACPAPCPVPLQGMTGKSAGLEFHVLKRRLATTGETRLLGLTSLCFPEGSVSLQVSQLKKACISSYSQSMRMLGRAPQSLLCLSCLIPPSQISQLTPGGSQGLQRSQELGCLRNFLR